MTFCKMKLVIPRCGALYCPWEIFKEIALSVIETDCINAPLQGTVKRMSSTSSGDEDDDKYGFEDYKVILVTGAVCIVIFAVGLAAYSYFRRKHEDDAKAQVLSSGGSNNIY